MSNFCETVYLCTLFDRFFGEEVLVKSILEKTNIEITHNISLERLDGDDELESVTFVDTVTKNEVKFEVSGLFIAIGQVPHNDFLKDILELMKKDDDQTRLFKYDEEYKKSKPTNDFKGFDWIVEQYNS